MDVPFNNPNSAAVGAEGILGEWVAGGGQSCQLCLSSTCCFHCRR